MGNSKIQWTDATWNPVVGCTKVSTGCDNCYAERMAYRLACMALADIKAGRDPGVKRHYLDVIHLSGPNKGKWNGKVKCVPEALEIPLHWKNPRMIFVCSMSDLFHPLVPFEFIAEVYKTAAFTEWHTHQFLTKRIERALEFFKWLENKHTYDGGALMFRGVETYWQYKPWPLPNVWLGVTAENQEMADKRIPILLQIPAAVRFVSIEPMLSEIDLRLYSPKSQAQRIAFGNRGSFTGKGYTRPIPEQCQRTNVPVFVKQIHLNGKAKAIEKIKQFPEDLRIREYPKGGEV